MVRTYNTQSKKIVIIEWSFIKKLYFSGRNIRYDFTGKDGASKR